MIKTFGHYIKRFIDACRDTKRIVFHFDMIKLNGYFILIKIFIIRFFYSFAYLRNSSPVIFEKKILDPNYFEGKKFDISCCVKEIDKKGYSSIFNINSILKNELLDIILNSNNIQKKKLNINYEKILKLKDETLNQYLNRLTLLKVNRVTGYLDINNCLVLKKFLTSREVMSVVKNYLNTSSVSISAMFFISNPTIADEHQKNKVAQTFHWDNDFRKFLKFYIYLTDVDDDSGPHIFVEKTHKFKERRHSLCRVYDDESVYRYYEKIKRFTGKSGSSFFVDSYGLHKGEPPKKNSRIMLNIHFGSDKILYSPGDIYHNINL
jgi:hypothetical protein